MTELPIFVPPMLAKIGEPFDSDEHLFEVKWDGMRAIALVDRAELRMFNRQRVPLVDKYPELGFLADLPRGTVLDGEIVVTREGRPDFHAVMARQHARGAQRYAALARTMPATYIVFDLVYEGWAPLTALPLAERRARLERIVASCSAPRLVLSSGIVGSGRALFEQASRQELEGIVGKRLASGYAPGLRSDAWTKIKRRSTAQCVILGYLPEGTRDFKSLVVALEDAGRLRCVGLVGGGIDQETRAQINELLPARPRAAPLVPCDIPQAALCRWVEPGLYCTVSFAERTPNGNLRAPVFVKLFTE